MFQETYEPDRKDVYIVKEVSGQGAVYDTWMFGDEPADLKADILLSIWVHAGHCHTE